MLPKVTRRIKGVAAAARARLKNAAARLVRVQKPTVHSIDHDMSAGRPRFSNQPQPLQARVAVLADDDVVVHGDAERARHRDDRLRHFDVGARRGRVA
jgi:hypothetical protein